MSASERQASPQERTYRVHQAVPFLDAVAWHLSQDGAVASDVVRAVTDAVAGGRGLEQEALVEQALLFWEGRAVLRRERVGGNDRFDFAHDSLRDFVAAQHLTRLHSEDRRTWITHRRNDAIARFAVALMGEAVLDDIFAADPPTSADALIRCARACGEMHPVSSRFANQIAANAAALLASNIPHTVTRIVEAIVPLVRAAPDAFGEVADTATRAGETWNVLAAWVVRLETGVDLADPDALLELLVRRAGGEQIDSAAWELWNELLEPALDALVRAKKSAGVDKLVETLVLGDARLSAATHDRIVARLSGWGYSDLLARHRVRRRDASMWLESLQGRSLAADRAFLELVEATFGPADDRDIDHELPNLSALLHAFDFWNAASTDWNEMFFTRGAASMSVLLLGAARAAGCDEARLATEAKHALSMFGVDHDERSSGSLRQLGSGSPRQLDWNVTSRVDASIPHLLTALRWPGAYARVALLLLVHHADRASVRDGIGEALQVGVPYVVQVAEHLSDVLGADLVNVLAKAVATLSDATAPLLVTLAKFEPSSPRTLEHVTKALGSANGVLVDAAADAAMKLPTTDELSSLLRYELERWRKWAAGDGPLEKRDFGIVEPGTTLYATRVAEKLVKALAAHGALQYDDLLFLAREGAGANQALEALVVAAARDTTQLERALDDVATGALSARAAERLFEFGGLPRAAAERLLSYHEHPDASLRRAVVVGLRDCAWATRDDAHRIWTARLADSDVDVRNEAQLSLEQSSATASA